MSSNPAQQFVDSLITKASQDLNMNKADLPRLSANLLTVGLDFVNRGESMTDRDTQFADQSVDTALTTSVVRKYGHTGRAQEAAFRIGMAMLIGAKMPGVDLSALSR